MSALADARGLLFNSSLGRSLLGNSNIGLNKDALAAYGSSRLSSRRLGSGARAILDRVQTIELLLPNLLLSDLLTLNVVHNGLQKFGVLADLLSLGMILAIGDLEDLIGVLGRLERLSKVTAKEVGLSELVKSSTVLSMVVAELLGGTRSSLLEESDRNVVLVECLEYDAGVALQVSKALCVSLTRIVLTSG